VAVAADADGVHVGQEDGDPATVRARIGPDRLLGLSVEAPAHLAGVDSGVVDYVGAGPVRATATKPGHAPAIGFDGLAALVRGAQVPAVAIGGIGLGEARLGLSPAARPASPSCPRSVRLPIPRPRPGRCGAPSTRHGGRKPPSRCRTRRPAR
jgi:hypothetical protein